MQVEYRRDLYSNCLVLSEEEQPDLASYQVRMLMANELKGFLGCKVHQMDGRLLFYYDITSKQSLETLFEHQKISAQSLEIILKSLVEGLNTIKNFLLSMDGFLLDPRFIYMSPDRDQVWFCYLPGNAVVLNRQMREFSEFLLPRLDNRDRRGVVMGYAFYQLSVGDSFTAEDIQKLLCTTGSERQVFPDEFARKTEAEEFTPEEKREWERERAPGTREELLDSFFSEDEQESPGRSRKKAAALAGAAAGAALLLGSAVWLGRPAEGLTALCALAGAGLLIYGLYFRQQSKKKFKNREEPADQPERFREIPSEQEKEIKQKASFPREEGTACLSGGERRRCGRLIPLSPGGPEAIPLDKEVLLIGKSRQNADLVLDAPAVSRIHARLVWDGETYRISDLNSRNGTRVNQILLDPGKEERLKDGDEIQFADLTYLYRK